MRGTERRSILNCITVRLSTISQSPCCLSCNRRWNTRLTLSVFTCNCNCLKKYHHTMQRMRYDNRNNEFGHEYCWCTATTAALARSTRRHPRTLRRYHGHQAFCRQMSSISCTSCRNRKGMPCSLTWTSALCAAQPALPPRARISQLRLVRDWEKDTTSKSQTNRHLGDTHLEEKGSDDRTAAGCLTALLAAAGASNPCRAALGQLTPTSVRSSC